MPVVSAIRATLRTSSPQPEPVRQLEPSAAPVSEVGYAITSYNTAAQTLQCVASLARCTEPPAWILVLDNGSAPSDFQALAQGLEQAAHSHIQLFRSATNLGFAGGSNFLIEQLLAATSCQYLGLLNNDAVARPELVHLLRQALPPSDAAIGMSGGRMHKLSDPREVDTLGITLYASLMPADRKDTQDPYLGPTAGCCLMTRAFVEDVQTVTGYCFDERFFCYCEDTDLVLRANLLGYRPAYVDQVVALHEGQASSRTQGNTFIPYHGLRNSLWMHWKTAPTRILLTNGWLLLLAHLLTIGRQTLSGRPGLMFAVYCDAFRQLPAMLRDRARIQAAARVGPTALASSMSPRFYRRGYAGLVISGWRKHLHKASQPS